ncbi:MAG: NAD(P)-dependent alcohol dehydrogenase [Acidobacteriota bacterium]
MKIKAAVVREKSGLFQIEELDLDDPREDEVLVRMEGCGICHTELSARDQLLPSPLPIVLGHEGSGIVEKVGARVRKVKPGDHVILSAMFCGTCAWCKKGKPDICSSTFQLNFFGTRADGSVTMQKESEKVYGSFFGQSSFASHALANERNTVAVPKDIPIEILGPLGCGVRTGVGSVIHSLDAKIGSSIAVFGTGSVGMNAILAASLCGCAKIFAVDLVGNKLAEAVEIGATHTINPSKTDPVREILKVCEEGIDYSLDCTGAPAAIRQAVDVLAPGGVCGLIGAPPQGTEVNLDVLHFLPGRRVIGINGGDSIPQIIFPELIDLYKQGRFPFDRMMRFYPLDAINDAVSDLENGKIIKAVLRPWNS